MRPALTVLAGIVVLVVAGCGGSGGSDDAPAAARPTVTDLTNVDVLKNDFNADQGRSRLLVIFSPT